MHSQNGNSDLGACSQVAVFVFDYIPCVRSYRTHSTAVNEINVERLLRHIYELSAWLVTQGRHRPHERLRRTECHALMSRLRVWIFYKKWYSSSNPHGHGSSCHPWQRPPVVNLLFTPPCLSTLFKKISTPSDRHRGVTFRSPWAFCVLGLYRKTVLWDTKFATNNV